MHATRPAAIHPVILCTLEGVFHVRRAPRAVATAALAAGLAACATLPPPTGSERVHAGRFAATTTLDGQRENTTGRFQLRVDRDRLLLDLATPIGTTLARIESGPAGVVLSTSGDDGREVRSRDAEALALEVLGWPLPVAGIGDWIEGRPAPSRPSRLQAGPDGTTGFEQDGWTIAITERFDSGAPRRLVMSRPAQDVGARTPAAPAITLRLVLDAPANAGSAP
jgi:outer membrane lipoprotein LolB